ncbi:MAG: hypothetical protein HOV81_42425 [Kofleriaceae bacterium]|nr:hypothetical protein [Kofleriaceae bacterium]
MRRLSILLLFLVACADTTGGADEEWGMDGPVEPVPAPGKEDSQYRKGLFVNTNTTRTQVWTARNKWEDTDTPAARAAGLAWAANSGLTWDEKYAKWLESLEWIPSLDNYSTTVRLTTPWGKTLPSPYLECAEMGMFLRITFAAWYELPLQFEAIANGQRVYFGHYGVRTVNGRFAESPEFGVAYKDYTSSTTWRTSWPKDQALRKRKLWGGVDEQPELGANQVFGAYVDEIHLNKRAAYFTVMTLNYLSSQNLADTANTYNIVPEAVRAGDILIERWQKNGIGHTLVVKEVKPIGAASLDVTTISGSMPRRQGVKQSGQSSKGYFTSEYTGGEGVSDDGVEYSKLGGGIKRWRVTKNVGGYWTNTWMNADEAHWINSLDYPRIAARPARFQSLLGQVTPQQMKTELLAQIADARHHLEQYPASCSARERREQAFRMLYGIAWELGTTQAALDDQYRTQADYVLGELEYTKSKTCCWNSSTSAMYDLVMKKAAADQASADSRNVCEAPVVFKSRADGYKYWADYAASIGRGAEWRAWSEDESCPQKNVAADTETELEATPYCSL